MPEREPKLTWGQTPRDLLDRWPKDADGTLEAPAFLTDAAETGLEADRLIEMLRAYGIPAMKQYREAYTPGRVVMGTAGYSVRIHVPASLLEDAQNLLQPVDWTKENMKEEPEE